MNKADLMVLLNQRRGIETIPYVDAARYLNELVKCGFDSLDKLGNDELFKMIRAFRRIENRAITCAREGRPLT